MSGFSLPPLPPLPNRALHWTLIPHAVTPEGYVHHVRVRAANPSEPDEHEGEFFAERCVVAPQGASLKLARSATVRFTDWTPTAVKAAIELAIRPTVEGAPLDLPIGSEGGGSFGVAS